MRKTSLQLILLLAAAFFGVENAQATTIATYSVLVDTSAIHGVNGYLDYQFNAGNGAFDAATVIISSFLSDGSLTGVLPDIGTVTGQLPGTVAIGSSNPGSEYTQAFQAGEYLRFSLTIDIPFTSGTATAPETFYFNLLDSDFNNLIVASSAPALFEIDLAIASNAPSVQVYAAENVVSVVVAPEPASFAMLAMGLLVFAGARPKILRPAIAHISRRYPANSAN